MVTTGEQLPYQGQILVSNSPVSNSPVRYSPVSNSPVSNSPYPSILNDRFNYYCSQKHNAILHSLGPLTLSPTAI